MSHHHHRHDYKAKLRRRARKLYEKHGLSVREVAAELGLSSGRTYVILTDADVKFRSVGRRKKEGSA